MFDSYYLPYSGEYYHLYTLVKLAKSHHFLLSFVCILYIVFVCLNCLFVFLTFCYQFWWIKMFIIFFHVLTSAALVKRRPRTFKRTRHVATPARQSIPVDRAGAGGGERGRRKREREFVRSSYMLWSAAANNKRLSAEQWLITGLQRRLLSTATGHSVVSQTNSRLDTACVSARI